MLASKKKERKILLLLGVFRVCAFVLFLLIRLLCEDASQDYRTRTSSRLKKKKKTVLRTLLLFLLLFFLVSCMDGWISLEARCTGDFHFFLSSQFASFFSPSFRLARSLCSWSLPRQTASSTPHWIFVESLQRETYV